MRNSTQTGISQEGCSSVVAKQEGKSEEDVWKELVEFHYSLGNSSHKFTTLFPFHKYKIIETINGDNSVVKLLATEEGQSVKQITYKLNLQNESWKVVSIEYKKQKLFYQRLNSTFALSNLLVKSPIMTYILSPLIAHLPWQCACGEQ